MSIRLRAWQRACAAGLTATGVLLALAANTGLARMDEDEGSDPNNTVAPLPPPPADTAWGQATRQADAKIDAFDRAVQSGDPTRIRKAALDLQADPVAVNRMNQNAPEPLRAAHNDVTGQIKAGTKDGARAQIAETYNAQQGLKPGDAGYARPEDVTYFEATNPRKPGDPVRVGQDWDVTPRVHGKDVSGPGYNKAINESYFEAAGGQQTFGNDTTPAQAAKRQAVEITHAKHPESYGGSQAEGQQILQNPKQPVRDPEGLSKTIEHKSNVPANDAAEARAAGNEVGAQGPETERIRQAVKQYDKQGAPRVEAQGGQVPSQTKDGMEVLRGVNEGKSPAEIEAALQQKGTTTEKVIKQAASLPEAAQKLKPPGTEIVTPETPTAPGDPKKIIVDGQAPEGGTTRKIITEPTPPPAKGDGRIVLPGQPETPGVPGKAIVDPAGNVIKSGDPVPAPPRKMIKVNLKPPPSIEGVPKGPPVAKAPPAEAPAGGVPPAGEVPTFRSKAFNTAGFGLLLWGAYHSIVDAADRALDEEEKAGKGSSWWTSVKGAGYAIWNFTGVPGAIESGTRGGQESMAEYKQGIKDGTIDPNSTLSALWATARSVIYGLGNFTGVKPAADEYGAMRDAEKQQAEREAAAGGQAFQTGLHGRLKGLEAQEPGFPVFEPDGKTPTPQALNALVGDINNNTPGTAGASFDLMEANRAVAGATTAGDAKTLQGGLLVNQAGGEADRIRTDANQQVNQADRKDSWSSHLADAVEDSVKAGGTSLGSTFGGEAGQQAAGSLFRKPKHSGPGSSAQGEDGETPAVASGGAEAPAPGDGSSSKRGHSSKKKGPSGGAHSAGTGRGGATAPAATKPSTGTPCPMCKYSPLERQPNTDPNVPSIDHYEVCPKCGFRMSVYKEALGPPLPPSAPPRKDWPNCPKCGYEFVNNAESYNQGFCPLCGYFEDHTVPPAEPAQPAKPYSYTSVCNCGSTTTIPSESPYQNGKTIRCLTCDKCTPLPQR